MKKKILPAAVAAGLVSAALRAAQWRGGFDENGLPVGSTLSRAALPAVLLLAAVCFVLLAWKLPAKRGESGGLAEYLHFTGNMPAALCAVAGAFMSVLGAVPAMRGGVSLGTMLPALLAIAAAVCVLYAAFALSRGASVEGAVLLLPVCCMVAYVITLYRADASNPVLAQIYVEILAVAALTYSAVERAAFAVRNGSPRACLAANAMAFVLALAAAAEFRSLGATLLFGGWALVELGFLLAAL